MPSRCAQCQEPVPEQAAFCIRCGALLRPAAPPPHALKPAASGTTMHLRPDALGFGRLHALRSSLHMAMIALAALGFAFVETIGIAQLIAQSRWTGAAMWPALVLVGGALLAENDWVNGALRRGLYGMLCWGMLPWLLTIEAGLAWLLLPALGWWLIWLRDRP